MARGTWACHAPLCRRDAATLRLDLPVCLHSDRCPCPALPSTSATTLGRSVSTPRWGHSGILRFASTPCAAGGGVAGDCVWCAFAPAGGQGLLLRLLVWGSRGAAPAHEAARCPPWLTDLQNTQGGRVKPHTDLPSEAAHFPLAAAEADRPAEHAWWAGEAQRHRHARDRVRPL